MNPTIIKTDLFFLGGCGGRFLPTLKDLLNQGYNYCCPCNLHEDGYDPWSGLPNIISDTAFFATKEEAENAARIEEERRKDGFKGCWKIEYKEVAPIVQKLRAEIAKEEKEKQRKIDRKEREVKRKQQKAQEMGLALEEYETAKKLEKAIKGYKTAIENNKKEIQALKEAIKKFEKRIEEVTIEYNALMNK